MVHKVVEAEGKEILRSYIEVSLFNLVCKLVFFIPLSLSLSLVYVCN